MDQIIPIILLILGVPIAAGIWLIARAIIARNRIEELTRRVDELHLELAKLKQSPAAAAKTAAENIASFTPATLPPRREEETASPPPVMPAVEGPAVSVFPAEIPPVSPAQARPPEPAPTQRAGSEPGAPAQPAMPPPIPKRPPVKPTIVPPLPPMPPPAAPQPARPGVNWEQFMGVKGFAWLGGMALFLGIAFFVKYSFDNNLVPPQVRVAIGFLAGLGLLAGGVVMSRKAMSALSQTLCATGVVVLYAVTFACRAWYHFEFFGPVPTFLLMVLITVTAFLLAVRLNALVVAVLGMLGGFLTPILLSTGQDNPLGLFGYLAILDAGLVFVALNRRWHFLTALAALGTALMQIGWAAKFFTSEKYFEGDKIFIALAVLLGFNALYLAANWLARRRTQSNGWLAGGNLGLAAVALGFTVFFFDYAPLAQRPVLLFGFVFLIDLMVAALGLLDEKISGAHAAAGLAVFGLLALWTSQHLTNPLLNSALAFYLGFALFHSALPAWRQHRRGAASRAGAQLNHCFPPLALLLVLVPIFKLPELSFLVWPFILLVDLLAIVLAALTATLLPVLAVLLLTLAATEQSVDVYVIFAWLRRIA